MAPKPLRNACNAEPAIQVRLELSLLESRQLQHWLSETLQTPAMGDDDRQTLLAKLSHAADQAVQLLQCPVCHAWFPQSRAGRRGQYCGPACKQKAYRQRKNARRRQIPTPDLRD